MQITGRGMVARSLQPYAQQFPDVVAFAGGVANSTLQNDAGYNREYSLLRDQLDVCREAGKLLIYFSSAGAIYGSLSGIRDENSTTQPVSRYGQHKMACETLIRSSGARYLIVRLANLVGFSQNSAQLLPVLTEQVKSGQVTLQKHATRDIMDVDDFAMILTQLLPVIPDNQTIIIASGISVPVSQLVESIQDALGLTAAIEYLNSGEPQEFSIARLQSLLPSVSFPPDYYQNVIRKYLTVNIPK